MEFERLSLFHAKHGSECEKIWSNDRPKCVKNFKVRKFMKTDFVQYTLTTRGIDYVRTQADFLCMNPEEIFLIARVFSVKDDKYPKVKIECEKMCEFLRALVCNFGKIDTKIHPIIAKKFKFPDFEPTPSYTEGYQNMSLGVTNFLE